MQEFSKFQVSGMRHDGVHAAEQFKLAWQKGSVRAAHWPGYCQQLGLDGSWMDSIATFAQGRAKGDVICKRKLGEYYLIKPGQGQGDDDFDRGERSRERAGICVGSRMLRRGGLLCKRTGRSQTTSSSPPSRLSTSRQTCCLQKDGAHSASPPGLACGKAKKRQSSPCRRPCNLEASMRGLCYSQAGPRHLRSSRPRPGLAPTGACLERPFWGAYLVCDAREERGWACTLLIKAGEAACGMARYSVGKCNKRGVVVRTSGSIATLCSHAASGKFSADADLGKYWAGGHSGSEKRSSASVSVVTAAVMAAHRASSPGALQCACVRVAALFVLHCAKAGCSSSRLEDAHPLDAHDRNCVWRRCDREQRAAGGEHRRRVGSRRAARKPKVMFPLSHSDLPTDISVRRRHAEPWQRQSLRAKETLEPCPARLLPDCTTQHPRPQCRWRFAEMMRVKHSPRAVAHARGLPNAPSAALRPPVTPGQLAQRAPAPCSACCARSSGASKTPWSSVGM